METSPSLRCLLVTVQGGQLILPGSLVVEVLPFAMPIQIEAAPRWVVGAMLWKNLTTPLVSLARLIFQVTPETDINSRIVIVNALGTDPKLPNFGILGTSAPRPVNLRRDDLTLDESAPEAEQPQPGVLAWVRYEDQSVFIPDMDALEAVLRPLVHRT
ncbi:MAG: chemotaxis protein CheW [Candidatus Competibacteraceae bacterium]